MIIGMDFGTTNTRAATFNGEAIDLLPLDPANSFPHICRTAIYITRSNDYYLGSPALNLYFNQNVGRPSRFKKVWVGEIMQVFAELPTFYRDVYIYEDEFSPGRLFLSIKTALRNQSYFGTVFQENWYSASDLAAIFLIGMKMQIDRYLDSPVNEVVLGRPVHFSTNPDEDKIAQSRLLDAAFKAGFDKVYLEYEPVAAALSYERSIKDKEVVLVFDFGGGTLDFTVMEIGVPSQRRVLATGGIPVAGDVFDQRLFRATIPKHLGEGDTFRSAGIEYPIPAHIYDLLTTPQEVVSLNTPQNVDLLRSIHQGAIHPEKTGALLQIVTSNYALLMFDLIERAKRELSERTDTRFIFKTDQFSLEEGITRFRFEQAIHREYEAVRKGLEEIMSRSGVSLKEINRVIRTGGSSQIPLFGKLLNRMFGYGKVREIDIFSSVTSGLAIRGHEIASGAAELLAYAPGSLDKSEELVSDRPKNQEVTPIDLSAVRYRMEVTRGFQEGLAELPAMVLVTLLQNKVHLTPFNSLDKPHLYIPEIVNGAENGIITGLDERILFASNQFKLIATPVKTLFMAQQASEQGIQDLLRLDPGEMITAMALWQPDKTSRSFLCLATRYGQARAFDASLLDEQVTKKPYFQLERRYASPPAALLIARPDETLIVGTNAGRIARALVQDMSVMAYDVIKAKKGEEVTAVGTFSQNESLLTLSASGDLIPVPNLTIPTAVPPASRGQTLRKGFHIVGFMAHNARVSAHLFGCSTQGRILRLNIPSQDKLISTGKPYKAFRLNQGEKITCLVSTS